MRGGPEAGRPAAERGLSFSIPCLYSMGPLCYNKSRQRAKTIRPAQERF